MKSTCEIRHFAAIAYGILGGISIVVMPMLVGVMIDLFALSPAAAGRVASVELLGVALGSLAIAALFSKWPLQALAAANVACIIIGNSLTIAFEGEGLYAARLVAGFGAGGGIALMSAIVATSRTPDRLFGLFFCLLLLTATAVFHSAGIVTQKFGAYCMYYIFIALSLLALLVSRAFTSPTRAAVRASVSDSSVSAPAAHTANWVLIGTGLIAMFLFFASCGAVWVYMERIAVATGLDAAAARSVLGNATIAGAVGAALATLFGVRFGRVAPLLLGGGTLLAMMALIAAGPSTSAFTTIALGFVLTWMFTLPYLMGAMAFVDPFGRAASLAVGSQNAGQALGPAVVSIIVSGSNYSLVGLLGLVGLAISLLLYIYVLRQASSTSMSAVRAPAT
jgi:predicted MFS family arabinose efflux permease